LLEVLREPRPAIRTVRVPSSTTEDETGWVFLTAAFICLLVIYVLAFQVYEGPRSVTRGGTLPFQVLFRDLPSGEQRIFREMQEGLAEALRIRTTSGAWPAVGELATLGTPPFAADPLDRSGLQWTQRLDGLRIEYVGIPSTGMAVPAFLIQIVEPEPVGGERANSSVADEEHQPLPDGTLLHVTYWKRVPPSVSNGLINDPALEGWKQIRVKSPMDELLEAP